jgi:hypothetical protein
MSKYKYRIIKKSNQSKFIVEFRTVGFMGWIADRWTELHSFEDQERAESFIYRNIERDKLNIYPTTEVIQVFYP